MKKFRNFTLLLALVMVISVFSACGSSQGTGTGSNATSADASQADEKPYDGTTITMTMQKYGTVPTDQENILNTLTAEFKDLTGITVKYSIVDWDQALTKMTLACTGGDSPDVYDIFFTAAMVRAGGDQYGPMIIDDVMEELGADNYYPAGHTEAFIDGHWYGVPWRADTRILMYNTDDFAAAGITETPKTWDELIEVAKKLTVSDNNGNITRSGMLWNVGNGRFDQTWKCLLEGAGGSIMNEDFTAPAFNSPAGEESLQFMIDAINVHHVMPATVIDPSFDPIAEFMAGKASMIFGVTIDAKRNVETMAPQFSGKIGGALLPSKSGSGNSSVASSAPLAVMKTSKNPEAAKEWLKFMCAPENMSRFSETVTLLNSSKLVMDYPFYSEDPWYQTATEQLALAGPMDQPLPEFNQMDAWPNGPLPKLATDVIGGNDIKTSLEKAEADVIEILKAGAK